MSSCSTNAYIAPFYLAGGIISGIAEIFVIFSYHRFKEVRTHPSSLVYWQSLLDLLFSLQFAVGYFVETCDYCGLFSFTFQFFVFGSLMWYLSLSVDLLAATRNPFSDPKSNIAKYHGMTWFGSLLTSIIVVATGRAKYRRDLNVCWIEKTVNSAEINYTTWVVLWVPMFSIIFISIGSYSLASYRLRQGLTETLKFRRDYLKRVRTYVILFLMYWLTAGTIYAYINFLPVGRGDNDAYKVLAFVVAGRGIVIAAAWTKNQGVIAAYRRWYKGETAPPEDNSEFKNINHALRMEVLQYSTEAIHQSVLHAREAKTNATSYDQLEDSAYINKYEFNVTLKEYATTPPFTDYAPEAFRVLRETLGIKDADYIKSIKGDKNVMVEKFTEGRSGSFFYFSEDGKYLVKTLSSSEARFFISRLRQYVEYTIKNRGSLITRFLGLHNIKLYNLSINFVVMQNVFKTTLKISDRYDLKGSWIDRNRKATETGGVYKDNDLQFKVYLEPADRAKFLTQIESDANFLCSLDVMDYSLLLGTHNTCYILTDRHAVENVEGVPFYQRDNGGLRAKMIQGPGLFFFGIIDVLQEYNSQKKMERWCKTFVLRKSKTGISAVPCKPYAERFIEKMRNITTDVIPVVASSFIMTRDAAITVDLGELKNDDRAPLLATTTATARDIAPVKSAEETSSSPGATNAQVAVEVQQIELGRDNMPPTSLAQNFVSLGGGGSFRTVGARQALELTAIE